MAGARCRRAPAHRVNTWSSHEVFAATHARACGIPQRPRRAFSQQISQGASICVDRSRRTESHYLRAGRIADKHIRWQLELAWAGLDADQLFTHRVVAEISPLLWRRLPGRMSYRFGSVHYSKRRSKRIVESAHPDLVARP